VLAISCTGFRAGIFIQILPGCFKILLAVKELGRKLADLEIS
jgi:hypothetical protein